MKKKKLKQILKLQKIQDNKRISKLIKDNDKILDTIQELDDELTLHKITIETQCETITKYQLKYNEMCNKNEALELDLL